MDTDVKRSIGDTLFAGVRQHLEAVGCSLQACEMLDIGSVSFGRI